jgi:hypothetical protein
MAASLLGAIAVVAGGAPDHANAGDGLTIPGYSHYPAMTIPVKRGTPAQCRAEADAFSRHAKSFLLPYPSDTDIYLVLARVQFNAFVAHRCDTGTLRRAVSRRLTAKQLRNVLAFFGFMGDVGRELARPPRH